MPGANTHFVAGAAVAAAVNGLAQWAENLDSPDRQFDWGEFLLCCLAGGSVALLPDLLEPADSPDHRQFFHSLAASAIVAQLMSGRHTNSYPPELKRLLHIMGAS